MCDAAYNGFIPFTNMHVYRAEISATPFISSVPSNLMRIDFHADAPFSIKEDIDGLFYGYIAFITVISFIFM